jgi:hypothetical protein
MTRSPTIALLSLLTLAIGSSEGTASDPCTSGLQPGQRPGPYTALIATGPQRGQPTCYICETGDRPAVVVFARNLSDPLARLVQKLDKACGEHKSQEFRSWVTFLSDDQLGLDPRVVDWSKRHAIRNVPLGICEDLDGPPSYRLTREADVTVLLFVKQKVVANYAFRAGELTDDKSALVLKSLPQILGERPASGGH